MTETSLNMLSPGENGIIERISSDRPTVRQRLLEMGLTRGTDIRLVRCAPMGDPIEVRVKGYRLSLRRTEAENVIVTKQLP